MSDIPEAFEFFHAAERRAVAMAEFARAASGVGPLDDDQTKWLMVGIGAGITCATEELNERGLLGGAS